MPSRHETRISRIGTNLNRYRTYGRGDTPPSQQFLGDHGFVGVNARVEASRVPAGFVSHAVNCRFRDGIAETRLGAALIPWGNKFTETNVLAVTSITRSSSTATVTTSSAHGLTGTVVVNISGADQAEYNGSRLATVTGASTFTYTVAGTPTTPATGTIYTTQLETYTWGTVHGVSDIIEDPNGTAYNLIATSTGVFRLVSGNTPQSVALPSGVSITGAVTFTQCFDVVVMFRGSALPPLVMKTVAAGFDYIAPSVGGDGTVPIPNGERGTFIANRLCVPYGRDYVWISDLFDYTRGDYLNAVRINQGDSGKITALAKFNDSTLIVLKENAVYALQNFFGTLQSVVLSEITNQFGCTAADSVVRAGTQLFWWGQPGVCSLRQTQTNEIHAVNVPFSYDIQPVIDRVNRLYESGITARWNNSRLYVSVPLDNAEVLGANLLPTGGPFSTTLMYQPTTAGGRYRFVRGDAVQLDDGANTYTYSTDYTATAAYATIQWSSAPTATTTEMYAVTQGVNSAVLVYDFLSRTAQKVDDNDDESDVASRTVSVGAWSGYDQQDGFASKFLFTASVQGKDRLCVVRSDGWVVLYEEDYLDFTPPYVDVVVDSAPANGSAIRVNGGTTVTGTTGSAVNGATTWGISTLLAARVNLWKDSALAYGYNQSVGTYWTAPGTSAFPVANGVRLYSTTGIMPVVTYSGTGVTVTEVNRVEIETELNTRGYTLNELNLARWKRAYFDLQTWRPSFTPSVIFDGVAEETELTSSAVTRSRTAYTTRRDAWTPTNANDDFLTAKREDYSVVITASAPIQLGSGIQLGLHQDARFGYEINDTGPASAAVLALVNTQGRVRLLGTALEADAETGKPVVTV